jgi:uncharacterized protein YjiS (DUF1127 family)
MVVAQFWQDWRRARSRARTARLLRDCDDHLLRDMGLTREGTRDPEIWNAETWNPWR